MMAVGKCRCNLRKPADSQIPIGGDYSLTDPFFYVSSGLSCYLDCGVRRRGVELFLNLVHFQENFL